MHVYALTITMVIIGYCMTTSRGYNLLAKHYYIPAHDILSLQHQ